MIMISAHDIVPSGDWDENKGERERERERVQSKAFETL